MGGAARRRLAAVDATLGTAEAGFAPTVSGSGASVIRVDVLGDMVFFGGRFSMVNGSSRNNAAAVKAAPGAMDDGTLLGWNPDVGGDIYDIDAFGDDVYLVGGFGTVGGSSRPGIAMVDALATGGALRAWRPVDVAGGSVSVIDASDTAVLFGGLLYDLNYLYIGAVLYPEGGLPGVPPPPTTPRARLRGTALTLDWGAPPLGARPSSYVIEAGTGPGLSNIASVGSSATTSRGGSRAGHLLLPHAVAERRGRERCHRRTGLRRRGGWLHGPTGPAGGSGGDRHRRQRRADVARGAAVDRVELSPDHRSHEWWS